MDLPHTIQELSVQAVGFLVLFVIMKRVAWRPLLTLLDQRRARIEEDLRRAAQTRDEVARLEAEYRGKLATIHEEARQKIQEAILESKRIALEVQEQARAQGQTILAKSKEAVELELAKAKVTLRDQVAAMTMDAVERILRQKLDAKTDRRVVDAVLDELENQEAFRRGTV